MNGWGNFSSSMHCMCDCVISFDVRYDVMGLVAMEVRWNYGTHLNLEKPAWLLFNELDELSAQCRAKGLWQKITIFLKNI